MTHATEQHQTAPITSLAAAFAVYGSDRTVVIPDAEIRRESVADAEKRVLAASPDQVLGVVIPFERGAEATTFLGRPSEYPEPGSVPQPGSFDVTSFAPDIRFNEHETARFMLALEHVRNAFTTDQELSKIVLSRAERYTWSGMHPAKRLIARIASLYPQAYRYHAITAPDAKTVIAGATPELFLRRRGSEVRLQPLAGTVPKSLTKAEAEEQLRTPKYLEEHALLVDFMLSRLGNISRELSSSHAPSVIDAASVWHLGTEIRTQIQDSVSITTLVDLLHPSPAVCGVSQNRSGQLIGELEPARGYYGGLIGWLTPQGDCDLYVALRGLEVDADQGCVTLRAGGGITAASDPITEFEETSHKLDAMRVLIQGVRARRAAATGPAWRGALR